MYQTVTNERQILEWFSIKIDLKASCVLITGAGDEREALYEAHIGMIPVNKLFEVEKDAVRITKLKVNGHGQSQFGIYCDQC